MFKTIKLLISGISQCEWANGIGNQVSDENKIFCLKLPASSDKNPMDSELVSSSSYFENGLQEHVNLNGGVPVVGVVPNWLVAITVAYFNGRNLVMDIICILAKMAPLSFHLFL